MCTAEYLVLFTWDAELPIERWQIKSVGPLTETSIAIVNTTSDYYLRVQARNQHGFGPKSDVVRFRATQSPPAATHGDTIVTYSDHQYRINDDDDDDDATIYKVS